MINVLFGLVLGVILFIALNFYATWRDNSMVPIEELRDDCEVVRTEPHKTVRCGGDNWWVIPGHVTL